ncbi:hypothetical protein QBE52_17010 [Clostridiaceae bacterium 35-E11]
MTAWWHSMESFEKVFWYFAIPFSVVLAIQLILTFTGMGGGGDVDTLDDGFDVDGDTEGDGGVDSSFQLFTVRNFITFFTVFGWAGIATYHTGASKAMTIFAAITIGIIVMGIVASLFYFIMKLSENGTMNLKNAVGATGEVYLSIPERKSGIGKVQITVQGSLKEMEAMTEGEAIPTDAIIKVVDVLSDHILLVEKIH